ncbi:MAG: GGDEF domain-containing protein [Rubrivivax sp.]|nr:GGDEF domain-containing protein [Rubrivivax sp.]
MPPSIEWPEAEAFAMHDIPDPKDTATTNATRELARLQKKILTARAVLAGLLQDVVAAQSRLDLSQAAQLIEVNEKLVVAALHAQIDADTATQALDMASHSAGHDALTQLPNRVLLLDRLAHALASAKRHGTRLALFFLDIDNFKQINDTYGHAVGDEVLVLAAQHLASSVRAADTVSRFGGDEFVVLLSEVSQLDDATLVADKVIAAIGAYNHVGGHVLQLSVSIGISLYPDHGDDAAVLIAHADASMYRAKRQGGSSFALHRLAPVGTPDPIDPAGRHAQSRGVFE